MAESWARRLLREMPADPEKLLERQRYWDPVFVRVFLDHADDVISRDPRAGLKLARVAPKLALLVPEAPGRAGRRKHREQLVRAHAIRAAAYRATGRLDSADREYAVALKIADSATISPAVWAHLAHRLAVLRAWQKRFTEALALADEAVEIFRRKRDRLALAEALVKRGYVLNEAGRFAEAIPAHGEALELVDPKTSATAARVHYSALINLAHAVAQSPSRRSPPRRSAISRKPGA